MRAGAEIFVTAVLAVIQNPLTALRVVWLPFAISLAVYIWAEHHLDTQGMAFLTVTFLADTLMLPLVAVGWHRYRLLGEHPGALGVQTETGRLLHYAFNWMVLGLMVGLAITVVTVLVVGAVYLLFPENAITSALEAFNHGEFDPLATLLTYMGVTAFTWAFFSVALTLPDLAIRAEPGAKMNSWAVSRKIEPAVKGCAVLASLGTLVLFAPTIWTYDIFPDSFVFEEPLPELGPDAEYRFSWKYLTLIQVCWMLITLFGASILTELYRAAMASEGERQSEADTY